MAQHGKHRLKRRFWERTHRKPVPVALRAAATLTLAGAASTAGLDGTALADREPTLAEIGQQVDDLHHEAEQATEEYNAATEAAADAEAALERLTERAARRTAELNTSRDLLGAQAGAEYRGGGLPGELQLALSADPDDFLRQARLLDRSGDHRARTVRGIEAQLRAVEQLRAEAEERTEELAEAGERADEQRAVITDRLAEAEELLATRTAAERAALLAEEGAPPSGAADRADRPAAVAPNERAAAAVAFAFAQLGKPYGWGATGPDAFDCSGLTQAAWSAAGVSLPRTSYRQVDAGTRVPRSELAPGDLVFYYSGLSHVGIYVGGGQIVHASRSGTPVRVAPVDSMPFAAATRPA